MTAERLGDRRRGMDMDAWNRLISKAKYRKCLFADDCDREVINAHSISRAVLESIQHDRHVMTPDIRLVKGEGELPAPRISFVPVGIREASTGTFTCHLHDGQFRSIDVTPMDLTDPRIRDLLLYRAVLRELWLLLRMRPAQSRLDNVVPSFYGSMSHPEARITSLFFLRNSLIQSLGLGEPTGETAAVEHMVRRIKSNHPILACSYAFGGTVRSVERATGIELPTENIRRLGLGEPHTCWGLTVIPQQQEHEVLFSWLRNSRAAEFFVHVKNSHGRELESAISAQLIQFCERWFLHPMVWNAYNDSKRQAILAAYDNLPDLLSGRFRWSDRGRQPWHEYAGVPNRHQLNMFRYNPRIFGENHTNDMDSSDPLRAVSRPMPLVI